MHEIQIKILKELLFKPVAKFSDLNVTDLTNDHFTFHIKRLVELNLVQKSESGYELTTFGKEYAGRLDTDNLVVERQPKTSVLLICTQDEKLLIQQRLKQPYFGFHGFITGKTRWGETISETAIRELAEETGLTGVPKFIGLRHKMDYSVSDELLEDKLFFVVKFNNPTGKLIESYEGGKNLWLTEKNILELPNLFPDMAEFIAIYKTGSFFFSERKYTVEKY